MRERKERCDEKEKLRKEKRKEREGEREREREAEDRARKGSREGPSGAVLKLPYNEKASE